MIQTFPISKTQRAILERAQLAVLQATERRNEYFDVVLAQYDLDVPPGSPAELTPDGIVVTTPDTQDTAVAD